MSAATQTAACAEQVQQRFERRGCARPGAGPTLGQVLARTKAGLEQAGAGAACPVCAGHMRRDGLEGRCSDCGTRLL